MANISVVAIEALQSIQNATNDVPLIAGKTTYLRVYLRAAGVPAQAEIRGRLSARVAGETVAQGLASVNAVMLSAKTSLAEMRLDWSASLNFILPQSALIGREGETLLLQLDELEVECADATRVELKAGKPVSVKIADATGLRCRVLRFRCRDEDNLDFVEADRGDVDAIRRYVDSSFPVARIDWSDIRLAAPREFRALFPVERNSAAAEAELTQSYMLFFQHMLAIRERDVRLNRSADTLYLGLLDDPSGRFGGAAMDSPQFAAPHVVSIATPEAEGDLGAHEIAHALGRRHPGIPDAAAHGPYIGQRDEPGAASISGSSSGLDPRGFLSAHPQDARGKQHIAIDNRFSRSAPELLPHDAYFDLMTYRYPKWVSDLTYLGLMERLQEIYAHRSDYPNPDSGAGVWTVIGEYDLHRQRGRIFYAARSGYKTPMPDKPKDRMGILQLGWTGKDKNGKKFIATEDVYLRRYGDLDGSNSVGVFQHTIGVRDSKLDCYRRIDGELIDAKNRDRFWKSFDRLGGKHGVLQLRLNAAVVDELGQCKRQRKAVKRKLKDAVKHPLQPNPAKPNAPLASEFWLEYSLDDGGYFVNFDWRWDDIEDASSLRSLTSIACQRAEDFRKNRHNWETVAVSQQRRDRIWISPAFFGDGDNDAAHPIYGHNFPGGPALRQLQLAVRIEIDIGLKSICREGVLRFPPDLSRAVSKRRDQAGGYQAYPGSGEEIRIAKKVGSKGKLDRRRWYSDSI